VATSTPVSDPMGDYTWQFFRKADRQKPGLYQLLNNKALKLSGTISIAPGAKTPYVTAFEENKADAYIMYCTNAVSTKKTLHRLSIVPIPEKLNINGDYGIAAHPDSEEGKRFVDFVMQSEAQSILRKHGFR
jgi:ABC-type molybdate transport system substrate-binding protein